jgi:hypothetical protein
VPQMKIYNSANFPIQCNLLLQSYSLHIGIGIGIGIGIKRMTIKKQFFSFTASGGDEGVGYMYYSNGI